MSGYVYSTSESVTEGHPDKVCDQISDAVLDAFLTRDKDARVAVETMVSKNTVVIAGEISSAAKVDITATARAVIRQIGYTETGQGFDADSCLILTNINRQSPDIALGVDSGGEIGGGDQGIMYGYACREAPGYMPLTCYLSHQLVMSLAKARKEKIIPWLYPDGKAQVTMKYDDNGKPQYLSSIVVSAQHEDIDMGYLRDEIMTYVIDEAIDRKWLSPHTTIHINPTGRFVIGGPAGDTGLTGRKIMVDTYGGAGRHGGGAFSGKDATKVDRTAAYMARYAAKNIVAAGLAERCEVAVAYVIGQKEPEMVTVDTFGTERLPVLAINQVLNEVFSFRVSDMIETLELKRPQFLKTAVYGHFGREDMGFRWECLDKKQRIRELSAVYINELLNTDDIGRS
ncbi:MAG: methionine adenosyltransferase [Lachnospiraceae bacterium]